MLALDFAAQELNAPDAASCSGKEIVSDVFDRLDHPVKNSMK